MQELDISYAFALPPDKIIPYFQSKGIVITGSWKELWQEAHHKAFTMANVFSMDVLQTVKQGVDKAIAEGIPYEQFKKENGGTLELAGINPNRLHTVYRTNMQVAYQTGRYKELLEETHGIENREYWQYVSVIDPSTTDQCRGLNGRVYKYTDSFWKTYYPPNHFNCRATVQSLSKEMLQERGLKVSGAYHGDPPAEGWDYNPAIADYKPELKKYDPAIVKKYKQALANEPVTPVIPVLPITPKATKKQTVLEYKSGFNLNEPLDSTAKQVAIKSIKNRYRLIESPIKGVTDVEFTYIKQWTSQEFVEINEWMANADGYSYFQYNEITPKMPTQEQSAKIRFLNKALDKYADSADKNFIAKEGELLQRKLYIHNKKLFDKYLTIGEVIEQPTFISASRMAGVYDDLDYNVRLLIKNAEGVDIGDISYSTREQEILLKPKSKFKVLSVTKASDDYYDVTVEFQKP